MSAEVARSSSAVALQPDRPSAACPRRALHREALLASGARVSRVHSKLPPAASGAGAFDARQILRAGREELNRELEFRAAAVPDCGRDGIGGRGPTNCTCGPSTLTFDPARGPGPSRPVRRVRRRRRGLGLDRQVAGLPGGQLHVQHFLFAGGKSADLVRGRHVLRRRRWASASSTTFSASPLPVLVSFR